MLYQILNELDRCDDRWNPSLAGVRACRIRHRCSLLPDRAVNVAATLKAEFLPLQALDMAAWTAYYAGLESPVMATASHGKP